MDKIVFFEIEEWEKEHLKNSFPDKTTLFLSGKAHENISDETTDASIVSTFIYSELTPEILSKFPNLKLIVTRSSGYDHIDLSYCKEKGIIVTNIPSYGEHTVAQHTFALILAISRKIISTVERSRRGNFSLEGLRGFDLNGKTIGVVGAGKIGNRVIQLGLGFGMNVLVFTKHHDESLHDTVRYVSLEELLSASDIITLHVPLTTETHHIINRENVKQFKKGSILINTARGPLVETQAILDGLETGILKAAGLDVLEEELNLKEERELLTDEYLKRTDIKTQLLNHVLLDREDVIFTSHNAFNSDEALEEILTTTINNIKSYFSQNPQNIIK